MILIDTSLWIDHLSKPDPRVKAMLDNEDVCAHPHIIGELALGNLRQFDVVIRFMNKLPKPTVASDIEVLHMIREHRLQGSGIGYTDAHLLSSALITPSTVIWTRDKRLNSAAQRLGIALTN